MDFVRRVIAAGDTMRAHSAIVAGLWFPYVVRATPGALPETEFSDYTLTRGNVEYADLISSDLLNRFHKDSLKIYYFPHTDAYEKLLTTIDLQREGASELPPVNDTTDVSGIRF
jgi:hypothetical protein